MTMTPRENVKPNGAAIVRSKLDQGFPPEHVGKGKVRAATSMPPTRERRHRRLRPQPEYDFRRQSHLHSPNPGSNQPTHRTTIPASTANRTSTASSTCFQPCIRVTHWTEDATPSGAIRLPSEGCNQARRHSSPRGCNACRPFISRRRMQQPPRHHSSPSSHHPSRSLTRSSIKLSEPPSGGCNTEQGCHSSPTASPAQLVAGRNANVHAHPAPITLQLHAEH